MPFELKPGQGSLFKNNAANDKAPGYRGTIKTPDGTEYEISAWVKEGKNGKFFSLSIRPPFKK